MRESFLDRPNAAQCARSARGVVAGAADAPPGFAVSCTGPFPENIGRPGARPELSEDTSGGRGSDARTQFITQPGVLYGMPNRCAYEKCKKEPLNHAVPACDKHLCGVCRMGVGMVRNVGLLMCAVCERAN